MNRNEMLSMFGDLPEGAKDLLVRGAPAEISKVLTAINDDLNARGLNSNYLCPSPADVFRAFVLTPPDKIRAVLVGQDPYIGEGEACGLSFSTNAKKLPPSLRNIYKCLIANKLMIDMPKTGDLSHWAEQGVLMLNMALTTIRGISGAHSNIWKSYIERLVPKLDLPGVHWMLFGAEAAKIKSLIKNGTVHEWSHPSPLSRANAKNSPTRFELCPAFTAVGTALGIIWDPLAWGKPAVVAPIGLPTYEVDHMTYWLFTDGGATANGAAHCKASWAFTLVSSSGVHSESGIVTPINIPKKKYTTSNQRGELTAILNGLNYVNSLIPEGQIQIICVTDSDYSLKCITKWYPEWKSEGNCEGKMNLDLIVPAFKVYEELCEDYTVLFQHVRSHVRAPEGQKEYFIWYYNEQVDKLCNACLEI